MGNCQAIDNASFVLQKQNGKAERFYAPISAAEIMKLHPGHYVALLLTTTFYSHLQPPTNHSTNSANQPLRVTRIKLLRPTDNLLLGHAYRLITTQEVMKGLKAKKNGKTNKYKNFQLPEATEKIEAKSNSEATTRSNQLGKTQHQMKKLADKHYVAPAKSKSTGSKPRGWHPSLNSISETSS